MLVKACIHLHEPQMSSDDMPVMGKNANTLCANVQGHHGML